MNHSPDSKINITLDKLDVSFQPGDPITGSVGWSDLSQKCESIEVRLIWFTRGKGDRDHDIVDIRKITSPKHADTLSFEFEAPAWPCSFSAKLISLVWSIEVITFPDLEAEQHELIISPTGRTLNVGITVAFTGAPETQE